MIFKANVKLILILIHLATLDINKHFCKSNDLMSKNYFFKSHMFT
jgi:hypothetical protein